MDTVRMPRLRFLPSSQMVMVRRAKPRYLEKKVNQYGTGEKDSFLSIGFK